MADTAVDIETIGFDDIDLTDFEAVRRRGPPRLVRLPARPRPGVLARGVRRARVLGRDPPRRLHREPRLRALLVGPKATFIWEMPEDDLAQQQLMMLNMDPPLHTRYRRLVNKGFTPRMVDELEESIHAAADDIIDSVIETGPADFVTDIVGRAPAAGHRRAARRAPRRTATGCSTGPTGWSAARTPSTSHGAEAGHARPPWSSTPTPPSCSPRSAIDPHARPHERAHQRRGRRRAALASSSSSSSSSCSPWPATRPPAT